MIETSLPLNKIQWRVGMNMKNDGEMEEALQVQVLLTWTYPIGTY